MMESTKFGQEGQRKYNTNGKRMNRRGKMVLGILGGYVPTDAPASNLLVAQCHWEQNVSSLTVSCLLLANCHASTTAAYNNRVMRLFLWILYKTSLCPIPQLRDFSTCIPPDAFALAQVKKIISNIGAAHKLCKNFWTSQLPKLQVSAFYFPEEMSNLILTSFVVWQEWPWLLTPAQHLHVFFFYEKWTLKVVMHNTHPIIYWALFTCSNISQVHRQSGCLAWSLSAEWGKFQELRMVSVPPLPSIAKLRMVSVGRFHRQALQHTHMRFERGCWQSIWLSEKQWLPSLHNPKYSDILSELNSTLIDSQMSLSMSMSPISCYCTRNCQVQ